MDAFWLHEPTSDVTVAIRVVGEQLPCAKLPGHSPLLSRASPVWQAALKRWQQQHQQHKGEKEEAEGPKGPCSRKPRQLLSTTTQLASTCQPPPEHDPCPSQAPPPTVPSTAAAAIAPHSAPTHTSHVLTDTLFESPAEGGQHGTTGTTTDTCNSTAGIPTTTTATANPKLALASQEITSIPTTTTATANPKLALAAQQMTWIAAPVLQASLGAAPGKAAAPTAAATTATSSTSKSVLELLCDSAADAAAAEQLLQHVYDLPLPSDTQVAVRMLLLADRFQVHLERLYTHVEGLVFDREDLALLARAADLEVSDKVKQLLQVKLLSQLEASADMQSWLDSTPVGLDLEYCMNYEPLHQSVLKLPAERLLLLVSDDRTKAASENTMVAAMMVALARAYPSTPSITQHHSIMQQLRWACLSPAFVSLLVQGNFLLDQQRDALQHAAIFPPPNRAQVLTILAEQDRTQGTPTRHLSASVSKSPRPLSWVTRVMLDFDFPVDQLKQSFLGPVDQQLLWGCEANFSGFCWQPFLSWRRFQGDGGSQRLSQCELRLQARTLNRVSLPSMSVVSAVYEVVVSGQTVVQRQQAGGTVWGGGSNCIIEDVLRLGPISGWPENEGALEPCVRDGRLRGYVQIYSVL